MFEDTIQLDFVYRQNYEPILNSDNQKIINEKNDQKEFCETINSIRDVK